MPSAGAATGSVARLIVEVEPAHLDRPFDYTVPDELRDEIAVGSRVEVVFAGRRTRGLVAELGDTSQVPAGQLRPIRRLLGSHPWVDDDELELLRWAARRFAGPLAAVVRHALPGRVVDVERRAEAAGWYPTAERPAAPGQPTIDGPAWEAYGEAGEWLRSAAAGGAGAAYWRPLPAEDLGARLVELVGLTLAGGRDALVVVPEPASAAADAIATAFGDLVADVRDDPGTRRAYRAWLRGRCGDTRVLIGERRVAFWPLEHLGLAVVVDEASPAHKERRSPRHHTREVALERARRAGGLGLLIGTVPSAPAWRLLTERRLRTVTPEIARERAASPTVHVDDRRGPDARGRIGGPAIDALRSALETGQLGVVLAIRRGEGRVLACGRCGEMLSCPRCASTLAASPGRQGAVSVVLCEGCGWRPRGDRHSCPVCGGTTFAPLAAGAQRIGDELSRTFPNADVSVLEGYAQPVPDPPAIVVMTRGSTQMDPPGPVGVVVLPDIDGQLRRPTLDAAEDALRLAMRVASWSDRVVVQTREPTHHAVQALVRWDPGGFWRAEASRRAELRFPPAAHAIRLDVDGEHGERVSGDLRSELPRDDDVLGPRPLEATGGRVGLLVKSDDRGATLRALAPLRETWSRDGADVRIDVDPVDVA